MIEARAVKWWPIAAGALLALLVGAVLFGIPSVEPLARKWVIDSLAKRHQSDVEIDSFHAGLFPTPHATIEGLTLRFHGRTDVPPIAQISESPRRAVWRGYSSRGRCIFIKSRWKG